MLYYCVFRSRVSGAGRSVDRPLHGVPDAREPRPVWRPALARLDPGVFLGLSDGRLGRPLRSRRVHLLHLRRMSHRQLQILRRLRSGEDCLRPL